MVFRDGFVDEPDLEREAYVREESHVHKKLLVSCANPISSSCIWRKNLIVILNTHLYHIHTYLQHSHFFTSLQDPPDHSIISRHGIQPHRRNQYVAKIHNPGRPHIIKRHIFRSTTSRPPKYSAYVHRAPLIPSRQPSPFISSGQPGYTTSKQPGYTTSRPPIYTISGIQFHHSSSAISRTIQSYGHPPAADKAWQSFRNGSLRSPCSQSSE